MICFSFIVDVKFFVKLESVLYYNFILIEVCYCENGEFVVIFVWRCNFVFLGIEFELVWEVFEDNWSSVK